jgi:hypothetical protein
MKGRPAKRKLPDGTTVYLHADCAKQIEEQKESEAQERNQRAFDPERLKD